MRNNFPHKFTLKRVIEITMEKILLLHWIYLYRKKIYTLKIELYGKWKSIKMVDIRVPLNLTTSFEDHMEHPNTMTTNGVEPHQKMCP